MRRPPPTPMTPARRLADFGGRAGRVVVTLWLCAWLTACGGIIQACWDFDGPTFEQDSLPTATVGRPYEATVSANIQRNAFDDAYDYEFDIRGALPPGVEVRHDGSSRRLRLVGVPTVAGAYSFRVSVHVRERARIDFDDGFFLCWTDAERTYLITVAPA